MLTGKYGLPHHHEINQVHNAMGATFEQLLSSWNTPHGPLELYFRYPNLEKGYLLLKDVEMDREAKARRQQELQEKGKSVF